MRIYLAKYFKYLDYQIKVIYLSDKLLAKEVANLDEGAPLGDGAVDGEMSVHGTHLVQVTLDDEFKPHISYYKQQFKRNVPSKG